MNNIPDEFLGLHHCDCVEGMKGLPPECIDLTVTSPPYDQMRTYNDSSTWTEDVFKAVANELYRITKPGGCVVWIVADSTKAGDETGTSFKEALYFKKIGFKLLDTMIWSKGGFSYPSNDHYPQTFEYMFVFTKGKGNTYHPIKDRRNIHVGKKPHWTYRQRDGSITHPDLTNRNYKVAPEFGVRFNVWNISPESHNVTGHPAVFPLPIAADHIRSWSNEGDLVLDPFSGSGTTAIACHHLNRRFIGFEIDEVYFNLAKKHIAEETKQLSLFQGEESWQKRN